ncbi:NAD(P)H-hydrate dehydratase [uncultured Roseovarius sp.]|uniref:NAD(P)H-hydrate dehydratase n=1 Tax=uncultured Roseovarius sp. TaxID=293344 RepID=UPI00260A06A4|nr:NAD(P)H-hydrate dehydratase [uncultured Roseovarius sp.]
MNILTAAQMRAEETAAIESGITTGCALMERAGQGLLDAILNRWPDLAAVPHRAAVLCGPGNNGGDGFVVARLMKARGWQVSVFLLGSAEQLPPDARANYDRWHAGDDVAPLDAARDAQADVYVDALFGTGLTRPLEGHALSWAQGGCRGRVVAVDLPSGLCGDSGRVLGTAAVRADLTVTFHRAKCGHYLDAGPQHCGRLSLVDIGLPDRSVEGATHRVARPCSDVSKKDDYGHKYSSGHALVLSGGAGATGAARLAARGALRVGAGVVTLGVPPSAQLEVSTQITALMLRRISAPDDLAGSLKDRRITALCLGPGLGQARARALVPVALHAPHAPGVVLDADALTAYAEVPEILFDMLHQDCVLTPHAGEFGRLFPDLAEGVTGDAVKGPARSKLDATKEAAHRAGCVVLLKGPDTVIAAPDGRCVIHAACYDDAVPWLATAGAGDVLAGFIAGLMARDMTSWQATQSAAWLHAACARVFGPGLIAEDLPEALPRVLREFVA